MSVICSLDLSFFNKSRHSIKTLKFTKTVNYNNCVKNVQLAATCLIFNLNIAVTCFIIAFVFISCKP